MKRPSAAAAIFASLMLLAAGGASASPILFVFTGLRGGAADTCKWFDDNLEDRSVGALTRQTDLLTIASRFRLTRTSPCAEPRRRIAASNSSTSS